MRLKDMRVGESGIFLAVPPSLFAAGISTGDEMRFLLERNDIFVIDARGARFALSKKIAEEAVLLRAHT
ncbi:MAG: hypothetical protein E7663_02055 [Ruminococcaceae bacterium]|nr:hypothetical protein [Oscillospiraceae bacterium]